MSRIRSAACVPPSAETTKVIDIAANSGCTCGSP